MRDLAVSVGLAILLGSPLALAEPKGDATTTVNLGPHRGQLTVWETGLELAVEDRAGKVVPPAKVQAHASVSAVNGRPTDKAATFVPRKLHSWATLDLTGAGALQVKITTVIDGKRHEETVIWRLGDDPARRNDGLKL